MLSRHEQYYLTFDPVPENKDILLESLEKIEKALGGRKLEKGLTHENKASKCTSTQTLG